MQVFLNVVEFGMSIQDAIEAPAHEPCRQTGFLQAGRGDHGDV